MANSITVNLNADDNLSGALEKVADAADNAVASLEKVEESVSNIKDDMGEAAQVTNRFESALDELAQSTFGASSGTNRLDRSLRGVSSKAGVAAPLLDDASESMGAMVPASIAASDGTDQLEEQVQELRNALVQTEGAMGAEALAALAMVGPNNAAAGSMDNLGDEADDARNSMAGAASMAELLSLQSSALSINVGAFTIALRNLTTQVPLLVTSLGNLITAFAGVAGAVGAIGVGGLAGVFGGAVAEVEQISGEMASMEERMQAIQAIGEEFMSMLREAIEPLVEMEGAVELFRNTLENLATTVRAFSQSIADSYQDGPLKQAITVISDAWMDSVADIGEAFEHMMKVVGVDLAESIATAIRALDDFILFATQVTKEIMRIFGAMSQDGALKEFLKNLMALGRQIAGGLAPALRVFFDIVGSVTKELSSFNSETIGAIVQVVALTLAVNRAISVFGKMAQPLAIVTGHLISVTRSANSATGAFVRMAAQGVSGLTALSSGFDSLSTAIATAIPMMNPDKNDLGRLADKLDETGGPLNKLTNGLSDLSSRVSSLSFSGLADSIEQSGTKFLQKTNGILGIFQNSVNSAFRGITLPGESVAPLQGLSKGWGGTVDAAKSVTSSFDEMIGTAVVSEEAMGAVAHELHEVTRASDLSEEKMKDFHTEIHEMQAKGELAGMTMDDLKDEMVEVGISSEVAEEGLENVGNEMTELSAKATIMGIISSALSSVAIAAGALAGVLAGLVLIIGTVAAGLMVLGSSGEDADDIISGMKETLKDLASAAMPFLVASGNMVIDIFNSIMFVAKELVSGFENIGVAMGLIDPSDTESGGFVSSFENILNAMIPVIKATGDYARLLAGILGQAIADIMSILVQFIEAMHIAEIISGTNDAIQALTFGFFDLGGIMAFTANVVASLISGIIKITAILGILTGIIGAVVAVIMVLNGSLGITAALTTLIASPLYVIIGVLAILAAAVIVALEKFGLLDAVLKALMDSLSAAMGLFVKFGKIVGNILSGIAQGFIDLWNEHVAFKQTFSVPELPGGFGGQDFTLEIPELGKGGSGGGSSGGSGGGGGGSGGPGPDDSDNEKESLFSGFDTLGGLGEAGKESMMGGSPSKVEYNEGDTRNNYQTEVNADPEEKGQMSRLVKDAMEEANSFRRQQEGHTR